MREFRSKGRGVAAPVVLLAGASLLLPASGAMAEDAGRRIEEVIVTAERREASVSDTSLSISAFDAGFIADFGLRNQEDLQNYIPATTIQPYDITVRGVGRTARTLGGDPGVSTYFNGVYSEDFGIASTEGGLFDLERVEVLRGPQGTLYGRNAVGGAVNFISKRPTDELEVEAATTAGNFGTFEFSGLLSGPVIDDLLRARLTYTHRERDGYIKDTSPFNNDINDYGDDNIALALELTPTENLTFYVRANSRDYDRKFNGGTGTHPIVVGQAGGTTRDTSTLAFGWRRTLDGETAQRVFTNPVTGAPTPAVRIRPGVDQNAPLNGAGVRDTTSSTGTIPNYAFNLPQERAHVTNVQDRRANGLKVDTNGQYEELFDHQAVQFAANWDLDKVALQYTFGYTDFLYERTTDEDKTGNTFLGSYDFYVNQENYNWQHELQVMFDLGENVSVTTGLFMYQSMIDQRLDLYDPIDVQRRFQGDARAGVLSAAELGTLLELFVPGGVSGPLTVRSAQEAFEAGTPLDAEGTVTLIGPWFGDTGDSMRQGVSTPGTFAAWDTTVKTRAYAAFGQGTWDINEQWALTLGLRYAKDEKEGQERLMVMLEIPGLNALTVLDPFAGFAPRPGTIPGLVACPAGNFLCAMNVASGALDGALNPASFAPGSQPIRFNGTPTRFVSYLPVEDDWDVWTWRANLDYAPSEGHLLYASATTGWKSGGFNLGFRSTNNPIYDPESVLAFEIGYKGRLLNDTMQLNASIYNYIYEDRQSFSTVLGTFGTGAAILNIEEQDVWGAEFDVLWLATDSLTLGGNASYTRARFDSDLLSINSDDPSLPGTLFTPQERTQNVKGNQMPYIPEVKATAWGSYAWNLGDRGTWELRSSLSWTDEFYTSIYENPLDLAHDFLRWDARVAWMSADGQWDVSAFVNNITNELGIREQGNFGELAADYLRTVTTTDPRVYGLTLRWSLTGR